VNIAAGDRVELQGLPVQTGKVVRIGRTWSAPWRRSYFVKPDDTKTGYSILKLSRRNIRWVLPSSETESPNSS
jgi:hypothetical protein